VLQRPQPDIPEADHREQTRPQTPHRGSQLHRRDLCFDVFSLNIVRRRIRTHRSRAESAAVERAIRLDSVSDNLAAAMLTHGRKLVDRAFKAVEHVMLTGSDHFERQVIVVAADLTFCHRAASGEVRSLASHLLCTKCRCRLSGNGSGHRHHDPTTSPIFLDAAVVRAAARFRIELHRTDPVNEQISWAMDWREYTTRLIQKFVMDEACIKGTQTPSRSSS
jgi:hypothetical protein